jgi:hypothetical protein
MSAERFPGALLPLLYVVAVLVLSAVGVVLVLRHERRHPSSYTGRSRVLGSDKDALDAAEMREQGRLRTQPEWRRWEPDVVADAAEAAGIRAVEEAARINVLHHP